MFETQKTGLYTIFESEFMVWVYNFELELQKWGRDNAEC